MVCKHAAGTFAFLLKKKRKRKNQGGAQRRTSVDCGASFISYDKKIEKYKDADCDCVSSKRRISSVSFHVKI